MLTELSFSFTLSAAGLGPTSGFRFGSRLVRFFIPGVHRSDWQVFDELGQTFSGTEQDFLPADAAGVGVGGTGAAGRAERRFQDTEIAQLHAVALLHEGDADVNQCFDGAVDFSAVQV